MQKYTAKLQSYRAEEKVSTAWQNENDAVVLHLVSGLPDSLGGTALRKRVANVIWS